MKKISIVLFVILGAMIVVAQIPPSMMDEHGNKVRTNTIHQTFPGTATEAGHPWISVGPFGGDVMDICADPLNPDMMFAAVGVPFFSDDGGDNWEVLEALAAISSGNVNSFEATGNGWLFATVRYDFGQVFRSQDGGTTWQTRTIPVNSTGLCSAADPNDTSTIYIGLQSNVSLPTNQVIVKSTDGGGTWTAFNMTNVLPMGFGVVSICVDPDNSQIIFAIGNSGFSDATVVASFDGGTTWETKTNNLPIGIPYNDVAIAGQKVFVAGGQLFGSQFMGVWQSDDYGQTWTNISTSFPSQVSNAIVIDPANADNIFVATEGDGIYYSTDGGTSWNFNATGAGENGAARCIFIKPGSSDIVYAGFLSLAICRSEDAGATWQFAGNGIATLQVDDIEISPLDPDRILVGFEAENSGGCYMSSDGGNTWELVSGLPGTRFSQVTFGADGAMYAWSNGPSSIAQEGLYKSTDNGATWNNMGPNIGSVFETQIFALTASSTDPSLVFIGGNNFGLNGWESMIYKSTNGGETWINTYMGPPDDFYSVRYLFIDPNSADEIIYAGYKSEVHGGFLKSTDAGLGWTEIGTAIPGTYRWGGAIVCDPNDSDKLLAGRGGYGIDGTIYRSSNGGNTWSSTNLNLSQFSKVSDILINPENTDVVYVASTQNGVQLSLDGGMNWQAANEDLLATNITGFSNPYQEGDVWRVYASTVTNSAFRTEIFTPGVGIGGDKPMENYLTVYPNPSNGVVFIQLKPGANPVKGVMLYDARSRLIKQVKANSQTFNDDEIHFELQSGVYFLQVISETESKVEKIIVQ